MFLILGGGDGLALREVLKYPSVKKVTLVDLDPEITNLAKNNPYLTTLNKNSLNHKKLEFIHSTNATTTKTESIYWPNRSTIPWKKRNRKRNLYS